MMTDKESGLTKQYLDECFTYTDGVLYWNERPVYHFVDKWRQKIFNSRQALTSVGCNYSGYLLVNLKKVKARVLVHRIIFMMHYGYFPKEIDHIDGNKLNNNISNLRATTHAQNLQNMKTPVSNNSGYKGVSFHKLTKKWTAGIRADGKWKSIGLFENIEDAAFARKIAEYKYYGEYSNGR